MTREEIYHTSCHRNIRSDEEMSGFLSDIELIEYLSFDAYQSSNLNIPSSTWVFKPIDFFRWCTQSNIHPHCKWNKETKKLHSSVRPNLNTVIRKKVWYYSLFRAWKVTTQQLLDSLRLLLQLLLGRRELPKRRIERSEIWRLWIQWNSSRKMWR